MMAAKEASSIMAKDFTATVHNPERAAEFAAVFGSTTVCIKSPLPIPVSVPGHPATLAYELDLQQLTADQRQRLIDHIAAKFGRDAEEVAADIDTVGVPILAEHVTIAVHNPQKWF